MKKEIIAKSILCSLIAGSIFSAGHNVSYAADTIVVNSTNNNLIENDNTAIKVANYVGDVVILI